MRRISKPTILTIGLVSAALIVGAIALVIYLRPTVADTSRVYVERTAVTAKKGAEVSIAVRINSKEPIDAVMAKLIYDMTKLRYKAITYDKTAFDSNLPVIQQEGSVLLQAAKLGGKTVQGDVPIATVQFTGLQDGTTRLVLSDANAAHAGVATKPQFEHLGIQPAVWWLGATALVLLVVATVVIKGKQS